MRTKQGLLIVAAWVLAALSAVPVSAQFINGGFESGTTAGWTKDGGTWHANPADESQAIFHNTGDPGKTALISNPNLTDALTSNKLYEVLGGTYALRVNNEDGESHYSVVRQSVTCAANDLYFGFAAVLEVPYDGKLEPMAPHFSFSVVDATQGKTLYYENFDSTLTSNVPGFVWHNGTVDDNNIWKYSDWLILHMDTSSNLTDQLMVTLAAYDCAWNGHGGYAYVDGFGATIPTINEQVTPYRIVDLVTVPEPGSVVLGGLGCLALYYRRRIRSLRCVR